ncbi:MAG: hypothetical protein Q8R38_05790 [Candidatus Omnitrophota bacterium]|nr:hypothetical protein [Candidatus Omnitrophota bacterium]
MINNFKSGKKCYLVEDHLPDVDYGNNMVIALTPEACYDLGRTGIQYKLIEDYYSVDDLKTEEDAYFNDQLQWFNYFDEILKQNITYCREHNIGLSKAHFYQLKYFIDSIIIQARVLREVLFNIKPDSIVYVCLKKKDNAVDDFYDLSNNKRTFFKKLVTLVCEKYGTPLSIKCGAQENIPANQLHCLVKEIKKILKRLRCKSVYYFFKYGKINKFIQKPADRARLSLFVLHAGWLGIDMIIKDSIARGNRVFFKDQNRVVLISDIIQKDVLKLSCNTDGQKDITSDCVKAFSDIRMKKDVIGWISGKCGLDISSVITPYFKHFIEHVCLRNLTEILLLKNFYKKENIDYVVARSSSEEDSIGAFLAAADHNKRVVFQHGITYDTKVAGVTELDLVDHYFAMDSISERYFKDCIRPGFPAKCNISRSSHYLGAIKSRYKNRRCQNNVIMYVPTKVFTGVNVYNVNFYTLPWYYEMQKSIIDYFAAIEDRHFIYKYASGQSWQHRSLLSYIKDKKYSNISVKTRPLAKCLHGPERIIFDYPSTGLFEAAVSGIPVMSLWHKTFKIDESIESFFGSSLKIFNTIPEAISVIANFIDAPARDFVLEIPLPDRSAIDYFDKD